VTPTPDSPPDDIAALRAALRAALAAEQLARHEAEARASGAEAMVAHLKLLIARLKRDKYGASSERGRKLIDQLELELGELVAAASEDAAKAEKAADREGRSRRPDSPPRGRPVRAPPPAHLPRERVVVPGPTACPCCGGKLSKLGEDITETLEVEPIRWKVIQTVRERFSCRACETVTQPPAPFHPIARGRAGPNLLAMILEAKFGQHLPLNRQSEAYAFQGIELSVSTLADWVGACTANLAPLMALIDGHVLAAERLHGDDTTVPVLAKGKTITGRVWAYVRDDRPFGGQGPPAAMFRYSRDRTAEHPNRHLAGYAGILQADAYAGYNALYEPDRQPGPITEAGCRVGGDVAAPTPHRPGRADFPHPVPHGRASLGTAYCHMILAGGRGWRRSSSRRRSHRKFPCRPLCESHFFQIRST
jgi:transposase